MEEKISILMPARNAAPYIAECIRSIVQQSYSLWELIIVEDHSTDNTAEIIDEFLQNDSRIRVLPNKGKGIVPALQTALEKATGVYTTRMDADDIMPVDRLNKMASLLGESPPKTIVTGLVEYFSSEVVSPGYIKYQNWLNEITQTGNFWEYRYRECVIASPNWMMRSSDLRTYGGFDKLIYPEDYDLVLRWYKYGFDIQVVPEVTLLWREHPARTSRNSGHYSQESFFKLKIKRFLELDYAGNELCILGMGRKAKLTVDILLNMKVPFYWLDSQGEQHPEILRRHQIEHFEFLATQMKTQVLLAFYPTREEREEISSYLSEFGLKMGVHAWFL